jgi:hypothetical protein
VVPDSKPPFDTSSEAAVAVWFRTVTAVCPLVPTLFEGSYALTYRMCRPSLTVRVSQEIAKGAELSLPRRMPSTKNSTAVTMPELSLAFAAKVTVPLAVDPLTGCVSSTLGGVTSAAAPPVGKRV